MYERFFFGVIIREDSEFLLNNSQVYIYIFFTFCHSDGWVVREREALWNRSRKMRGRAVDEYTSICELNHPFSESSF